MVGTAGVLLVVLGALALARAARQLRSPAPEPPRPPRLAPARVDLLRRAVGSLDPLAVYAVWLGDREVRVRLGVGAAPDEPWERAGDGCWVTSSARLGGPAGGWSSYAGLVRLARHDDQDVLVDLGRAPGPVALGGDPAAARQAALAAVRDLMARTGPGEVEVRTDDDAGFVPPDDRGGEVIEALAAPRRRGRLRVLVLWRAPDAEAMSRLTALVRSPEAATAVLIVGDHPAATWRLALDRAGRLDLGVLDPVAQGSA